MKLFADENIEQPIVAFLRQDGNDVLYAAEIAVASPDTDILARANREDRVIVTNDLDFGELVFRRRLAAFGVVLFRIQTQNLPEKVKRVQNCWRQVAEHLPRSFVIVTNDRIRVRKIL